MAEEVNEKTGDKYADNADKAEQQADELGVDADKPEGGQPSWPTVRRSRPRRACPRAAPARPRPAGNAAMTSGVIDAPAPAGHPLGMESRESTEAATRAVVQEACTPAT
ncbi:hypothetical protein [Streptomyces sp. NPDC087300]|uniref:hypothetical protein n=1 Tax=Streptomyces sp. NPDC087300 TaxID=3365780 RepID=UPI00380274B1